MSHLRAIEPRSVANPSNSVASFTTRLTNERLEALCRCARGVSLRFEATEIVDALVAAGYAERGVAGVVKVTVKGRQYLGTIFIPAKRAG